MKIWKKLLAGAASIVGVAVVAESGAFISGARAATNEADLKKQAELACLEALEKDTIEALEEFLRKYSNVDTTCTAKALDALNDFGADNGEPPGGGNPGGGYGQ